MPTDDLLGTLTKARPAALDPERLAGSPRQQADLAAILASRHVQPAPRRRAWWIGLPVTGVAVAAAAAVVVTTMSTAPRQDTGPVVLLDMATAIQRTPETPGTYWQTESHRGALIVVGTKASPYVVATDEGLRSSLAVHPGGQNVEVMNINATTKPRTAQDKARWEAAGSPSRVPSPGNPDGPGLPLGHTGPPSGSTYRSDGTIGTIGTIVTDYDYLRHLPATPAGLRAVFDKSEAGVIGAPSNAAQESAMLLGDATDLITLPAPPAVRAAAYRLIAGLPGLVSLGQVTDPLGRAGVAFTDPSQPVHGIKIVMVVDPRTDSLLAIERSLVRPDAEETAAGLTANDTQAYVAYTRIGWSDRQISAK
ncbi:MAG TPA: CU044_5270 family protein [Pseudonocardiaceae bacterium]|nr:CU044_5270 family protein [Pseudonocardiaceae bacterium]